MGEYRSLAERLDSDTDRQSRDLINAALVIEVNARWNESTDVAEVRAWVAELRNSVERSIGEIDPVACEKVIIGSITGDPSYLRNVPQSSVTNLTTLITFALAQDADMSDSELVKFLDRAEYIAAD